MSKVTLEKAGNGYIVRHKGGGVYVYPNLENALRHLISAFDEEKSVRVENVPSLEEEIRRSLRAQPYLQRD